MELLEIFCEAESNSAVNNNPPIRPSELELRLYHNITFVCYKHRLLTNVQKQHFGSQARLDGAASITAISYALKQENQYYEIKMEKERRVVL